MMVVHALPYDGGALLCDGGTLLYDGGTLLYESMVVHALLYIYMYIGATRQTQV